MKEKVIDYREKSTISEYLVMANEVIPDEVVALQQEEVPIFSIGDVSTITGLPKTRKTFLIASLATAFLSNNGYFGAHSELSDKRLLIIDTEQSRKYVHILVRRIYRLLGWDFEDNHADKVQVLTLRELTPEKRWEVVQVAIQDFKPNLVFIDGSADLVEDTNSVEQSAQMVNSLMKLSSEKQCHICNVVHTNPNSEKTRGHFGSELQRKSETVMLVQRDGETTTIKPQYCRSMDFAPFSFRINDKGLPEQCEVIIPKKENLSEIFIEIYSYAEFLSWGDLRDTLMKKIDRGSTACENRIKKGLDEKIIYKDIQGNYRLYIEPK